MSLHRLPLLLQLYLSRDGCLPLSAFLVTRRLWGFLTYGDHRRPRVLLMPRRYWDFLPHGYGLPTLHERVSCLMNAHSPMHRCRHSAVPMRASLRPDVSFLTARMETSYPTDAGSLLELIQVLLTADADFLPYEPGLS